MRTARDKTASACRSDYFVGSSAAFMGPEACDGPYAQSVHSARAISLSDGETLWTSEALSVSVPRLFNRMCVTTDAAVLCALGKHLWIFKVQRTSVLCVLPFPSLCLDRHTHRRARCRWLAPTRWPSASA